MIEENIMKLGDLVFWNYEHYNDFVIILNERDEQTVMVLMLNNMKKAPALYEELTFEKNIKIR